LDGHGRVNLLRVILAAQLLEGEQAIDDLTDPVMQAAANAAVQQLNTFRLSEPVLKLYR